MDAARRARLLERINGKGLEVAKRLEQIMNGKDATLSDLQLDDVLDTEGMRKEDRIRAWLDAINRARKRLNAGTLGTCVVCGVALPERVVDETPWMERCDACRDAPAASHSV